MNRRAFAVAVAILLAGCRAAPPDAVGTLEYDRITLTAPVSEPIIAVDVREGEHVAVGQRILRLEPARARASVAAASAETVRQQAVLAELEAGPRRERIAGARARLAGAQAQARDAAADVARLEPLARRRLVAAADLDRARAARDSAAAQVRDAQAALEELLRGSRAEAIEQGRAAVAAAGAEADAQRVTLDRLHVRAPRAGRVDALPYRRGDQPPAGAPVAVLLVDGAPYARVYVPEPIRTRVRVGTPAVVALDGGNPLHGRVRMIRDEPVFTPYYALSGDDAARLSWLAEIALDPREAADLPAGLPVRVRFGR